MTGLSKQLTGDQKMKLIDSYKAKKVVKVYQCVFSLKPFLSEMFLRNAS